MPAACRRQAPAPSQLPSRPQVVASSVAQSSSGSWPSGTGAQVPAQPSRPHDMHTPTHAVWQQTPSTQKPERHWSVALQGWPFRRRSTASGGAGAPSVADTAPSPTTPPSLGDASGTTSTMVPVSGGGTTTTGASTAGASTDRRCARHHHRPGSPRRRTVAPDREASGSRRRPRRSERPGAPTTSPNPSSGFVLAGLGRRSRWRLRGLCAAPGTHPQKHVGFVHSRGDLQVVWLLSWQQHAPFPHDWPGMGSLVSQLPPLQT